MSVAAELSAGGIAGASAILVTQPMDTIRIRMQSSKYTGVVDCARAAIRNEGIRGLYKGIASPCITVGFMNAFLFFSYESTGKAVRVWSGASPNSQLTLPQVFCAASCAGFGTAFVTGPTELVKCLAQTNLNNKGHIREEWIILKSLVQGKGLFSPYGPTRGLAMTIVRDSPSYGLYFVVYEAGTRYFGKSDRSSFAFGGLAGVVAWSVIYPLDVLKTRWQIGQPGKFTSLRHCFREVRAEDGWRTFVRGFNATMLRAVPQNGVVFVVYEYVKSMLT